MATDIVLKDRNGKDVVYEGIETVTFDTPNEDVQATFTYGTAEERTVDLNFVASAEEVYLEELPFTSAPDETYEYCHSPEGEFALTIGETYRVVFDGVEHTCVAQDASALPGMEGAVFIGNAERFELNGNNEPFAIGTVGGGLLIACLQDEEPASHTVAIYHVTKSVADMVVTPSADGKVLSKVTIPKPADLLPENIRAGKIIGGVEGTLVPNPYVEYTYNEEGEIVAAKMFGFTEIPDGCFAYMTSLTSVDLSESPVITKIGDNAFRSCSSLAEVDIPDSITSIGNYAFNSCTALTSITIPDNVTSIGIHVLSGCKLLTSVTFGGVTRISDYAFQNCTALTSIDIPDSITSIGSNAFHGCTALTSITIPDSVTSISNSAFSGCAALTSITIPDGMTSISNYTFYACRALASADLGRVVSIGNNVFAACTALTSITIPDSVTSIGSSAFSSCNNLTSATFKDTTTWHVGTSAGATTTAVTVTNASTAATYLRSTHVSKYWTKV